MSTYVTNGSLTLVCDTCQKSVSYPIADGRIPSPLIYLHTCNGRLVTISTDTDLKLQDDS